MTRLKRLLSYTGIFVVTLCMAAGSVILQFLFSNKNSTPNLVVGAEDTTFSQVLNKVMESDNISADFEISISVGGEDLCLYGLLEFDLAKILKAGDDIIDSLELFVDFNIESDGEVVPVIIKIVDGMCYTTVANNQLKFKVVDTIQNIGTILTLTGFEIPTSDLMANIDMSSLMGLMENISTDATEDGYQIIIPLFDMGEVEILADKKYNITEINLNELTFEGISVSAKLDIETDKEDFAITVSTEEEKGLDVSNLMKFATALSNTVEGNKLAGNIFVKTKHFENSFDFGFDLNKTYGYILGNIAGKDLQVVTQNKNVYLAFNDFKFKASYEDITSVVTFVKDYVESFANISIEEEINNELNSIQQTGLTLSDVLEKLNIVSVDVKEILNGLTFENDGNTLVFDYAGLKFVATIVEEKIDIVEITYNEYQISLNPTQNIKEIEIIDSEYVDYTFYQSILNRIVDFVESKKFSLTTSLVLGESEYKVYIKVDLNNGYAVELKTTIGEFNIKANLLNNVLYLQVNEQKVSYALKSGENLTNILSDVFAQFDFSEYENLEQAKLKT